MSGKTLLIMGSSGGLGKELTHYFAQKGYNLALHYFDHMPESPQGEGKYLSYQADVRNEENIKDLIAAVLHDFDRVDAVINGAGISVSEISWKATTENWNDTLAINLTGPFLVAKHILPHMRAQEFGRIIFISSIVAQTGMPGTAAYAASKAGLIGLTKSISKEVANKGITVNAIALGYFNAGMIDDVSPEMQEELKKQIPKNELGDPTELGALIEYMISDKASYLTGQTLNLNGGLYA